MSLDPSPGWRALALTASVHKRGAPALWSFLQPSSGLIPICPCACGPHEAVLQEGSHESGAERQSHLPQNMWGDCLLHSIVLYIALSDKRLDNTCNSKPGVCRSCNRENVCSLSGLLNLLAILVTYLKRLAPLITDASCSTDIIVLLYSTLVFYLVFPLLHIILCFLWRTEHETAQASRYFTSTTGANIWTVGRCWCH